MRIWDSKFYYSKKKNKKGGLGNRCLNEKKSKEGVRAMDNRFTTPKVT